MLKVYAFLFFLLILNFAVVIPYYLNTPDLTSESGIANPLKSMSQNHYFST